MTNLKGKERVSYALKKYSSSFSISVERDRTGFEIQSVETTARFRLYLIGRGGFWRPIVIRQTFLTRCVCRFNRLFAVRILMYVLHDNAISKCGFASKE